MPLLFCNRTSRVAVKPIKKMRGQCFVGIIAVIDAVKVEVWRQSLILIELEQGRNNQSLRQIAACPEQDEKGVTFFLG